MTEHLGGSLSALADGELGEAEAAVALAHLAGCGLSAAELAATEAVRTMVRALPPVEPLRPLTAVPSEPRRLLIYGRPLRSRAADQHVCTDRASSAARNQQSPRRPGRLAGMLAAAAASVAILALSGVQHDAGTGPQVAQLVQVHTTSPVNADPMSQLAPAALPVSFVE